MSVVASQSSPSPASLTTNVRLFITAAPVNAIHCIGDHQTQGGPARGHHLVCLRWCYDFLPRDPASILACQDSCSSSSSLLLWTTNPPSTDLCWLYNVIISAIISPRYLHCALFSVIMLNVKIPDCIFMYISSVAQYKSKSDDNSRVSVKINYYEKSVMVYDLSISGLCCVYVGF